MLRERLRACAVAGSSAFLLLFASTAGAATWESRQVPLAKETDGLFGIDCPSASLCVAVGSRGRIVTSDDPAGGAGRWRSETATPGPYVGPAFGQDRTSPGLLEAVSCPSAGMCAAVGYAGDLYVSADPGGGASTWRAFDLDGEGADTHLMGVSCPTPAFCVAVAAGGSAATDADGSGKLVAIGDPLSAAPSFAWTQLDPSLDLQAVSCPAPPACIAVAEGGRIAISTNPSSPLSAWREIGSPGGPGDLEAVDCPGTPLCLAGNAGGNVVSGADPFAADPRWKEANTGTSVQVTGISCPTVSRCAAVTNNGDVAVSRDPDGPPSSWSATSLIPFLPAGSQGRPLNALFDVSCPATRFCAAAGAGGVVFTSEDPFGLDRGAGRVRRGPKRPRLRIVRSDNFRRQSHTKSGGSRVTFRLRPFGRARGFLCSLDRRRFRRCRTPLRIYVRVGRHLLRARAIGVTGLYGPVARARFSIEGR